MIGAVEVAVGGQVSAPLSFNYNTLVPTPVLYEWTASPQQCPTVGGVVTLSGVGIAGCEVMLASARGNVVVQPVANTDTSISVRRLQGDFPAMSRTLQWCAVVAASPPPRFRAHRTLRRHRATLSNDGL